MTKFLKGRFHMSEMPSTEGMFLPQKLLLHKDPLNQFLETGTAFPIAFDIDLTNSCNHNCPMCNGAREENRVDPTSHNIDRVREILSEMAERGSKAVTFGGGGDPSVYPHYKEALQHAHKVGLDVGTYTNGQALTRSLMETMVECCTWMRVSLDADGPEIYEIAHGMPASAFQRVLTNIKTLIEIRREKKREDKLTISTCYLIGPKTLKGVNKATGMSKDMGVDYIRIRPYFQRPGDERTRLEVDETIKILEGCKKDHETENFKVTFPSYKMDWMDNRERGRKYKKCYGVHFMASITPDGTVYPCCQLKERCHKLGNIYDKNFSEIWDTEKRQGISDEINFKVCPNPCNFEQQNELLWDLKESGVSLAEFEKSKGWDFTEADFTHVNFI